MNDGLISRVKRLVTGSVHGLVDSIESAAPETVMREAIREIDEAANEVRTQLGRTIANRHHARHQQARFAGMPDKCFRYCASRAGAGDQQGQPR